MSQISQIYITLIYHIWTLLKLNQHNIQHKIQSLHLSNFIITVNIFCNVRYISWVIMYASFKAVIQILKCIFTQKVKIRIKQIYWNLSRGYQYYLVKQYYHFKVHKPIPPPHHNSYIWSACFLEFAFEIYTTPTSLSWNNNYIQY